jgi:hypothetical protein
MSNLVRLHVAITNRNLLNDIVITTTNNAITRNLLPGETLEAVPVQFNLHPVGLSGRRILYRPEVFKFDDFHGNTKFYIEQTVITTTHSFNCGRWVDL